MSGFPRTSIGGLSVSRMIIGSNWFLGFSHCSVAKDQIINDALGDYRKVADIMEVFLKEGVDTFLWCGGESEATMNAVREAQDRTGREMILIATPGLPTTPRTPVDGFDEDKVARILDVEAEHGVAICMPHTSVTDQMVDMCTRQIRQMDRICEMIRERGMIPGLSTHVPETIVYADETGLDVETYISMLNAAGFLMHWEVDWTLNTIHRAAKPVIVIKPMAAGRIPPVEAMTFIWNAIREQDMVTVGTMSPAEAAELIEMSLRVLDGHTAVLQLQWTRSKATGTPRQEQEA